MPRRDVIIIEKRVFVGLMWAVISLQIKCSELFPRRIGIWLIELLNDILNRYSEIFHFSEGECELCSGTCYRSVVI